MSQSLYDLIYRDTPELGGSRTSVGGPVTFNESYGGIDSGRDTAPNGYSGLDQYYADLLGSFDRPLSEGGSYPSGAEIDDLDSNEDYLAGEFDYLTQNEQDATDQVLGGGTGTVTPEEAEAIDAAARIAAATAPTSTPPGMLTEILQSVFSGVTGIGQDPQTLIHGQGPLSGGWTGMGVPGGPGTSYVGLSLPGPISTGPLIIENAAERVANILSDPRGAITDAGTSIVKGASGAFENVYDTVVNAGGLITGAILNNGDDSTTSTPPVTGGGTSQEEQETDDGITHGAGAKPLQYTKDWSPQAPAMGGEIVANLFPQYGATNSPQGSLLYSENPPELTGEAPPFGTIQVTNYDSPSPGVNLDGYDYTGGLIDDSDPVGDSENPTTSDGTTTPPLSDVAGGGGGGSGGGTGDSEWEDFYATPEFVFEMLNKMNIPIQDYLGALFKK